MPPDSAVQAHAVEQLGDDQAPAVGDPDVVDRDDPGVLELGDPAGLPDELIGHRGRGPGRPRDLDRDRPLEPPVEAPVGRPETPLVQLLPGPVAAPSVVTPSRTGSPGRSNSG